MAIRAMLSILLFLVVYIFLVVAAVGLTFLLGWGGIMLVALRPSVLTIGLGLGMTGAGVLILIFLLKFIFKRHIVDRSHLTEIRPEQQPQLFAFIREIVDEVHTKFPKKVYLSADVNASVFYDSGFWSMFLPVKKNLHIGIGLVNTVSVNEFRAILAHEFGHFSQRSMKVGSYVYNVNQVIYNMLYDNASYDNLANRWGNLSWYFSIFVTAAVKVLQGVQAILRKVYDVVNLSYLGLSREMEFHADEVAANVAGSRPLMTSLPRLDLANQAYETVVGFYQARSRKDIVTANLYPQQAYVMNFLAAENNLPLQDGLPVVTQEHTSRYNKSKLVIKDQWASHPATEDRILALETLNIPVRKDDREPAMTLFINQEAMQEEITRALFSEKTEAEKPVVEPLDKFIQTFTQEYRDDCFPALYNNFYNHRTTVAPDPEKIAAPVAVAQDARAIFTDAASDMAYTALALERDIDTLRALAKGDHTIKTFDYDGRKYKLWEIAPLVGTLEENLNTLNAALIDVDHQSQVYFFSLAARQEKTGVLKNLYDTYISLYNKLDDLFKPHHELMEAMDFMQYERQLEVILQKLEAVRIIEAQLKLFIKDMLTDTTFHDALTNERREGLAYYEANDLVYIGENAYNDEALKTLFSAATFYQEVLIESHFLHKKRLLVYQAELEASAHTLRKNTA